MFLIFLFVKILLKAWLDIRNKNHILLHRDRVPDKFADKISLEEHQKAADYTVTKINAGQFFDAIGLVILIIWTLGGGIEALAKMVSLFNYGTIASGILFFAGFGIISTLISLPQGIYTTFVIEEKFGFNKTTPQIFIKDLFKGLFLGALIGLPVIAGILWLMESLGSYWWVSAWIFFTLFQFILLWAYPRFIAPLFNKFTPMEDGELKEGVLELLNKTGFSSNGLFVMNASLRSSHGNAYFTGFGKNKRIVFFDTLLKSLKSNQVVAVLAHELGHLKKKHVLKQMIKGVVMSLIGFYVLGFLYRLEPFYHGHGVETMTSYTGILLFIMVSGIYTFFITPLSSWVSRKYEFEADEFASRYALPQDLIDALVLLYRENASTLTPDPLYSNFYHSHPPALIRIKHLERLKNT